uniref:R-type lectin 2 n=1 Tax=Mytilus galloprovincialis TaxID=29158 RepID=A0A646QV60_MYTGA|nr:R-type lectin 2 [Mytilus galloprovincialis]
MVDVAAGKYFIQNKLNGFRLFYNDDREDLGCFDGEMFEDQLWFISKKSNGYYSIVRDRKHLCYDGCALSMTDVARDNSLWVFEEDGDNKGFVRIINKVYNDNIFYAADEDELNGSGDENDDQVWLLIRKSD